RRDPVLAARSIDEAARARPHVPVAEARPRVPPARGGALRLARRLRRIAPRRHGAVLDRLLRWIPRAPGRRPRRHHAGGAAGRDRPCDRGGRSGATRAVRRPATSSGVTAAAALLTAGAPRAPAPAPPSRSLSAPPPAPRPRTPTPCESRPRRAPRTPRAPSPPP